MVVHSESFSEYCPHRKWSTLAPKVYEEEQGWQSASSRRSSGLLKHSPDCASLLGGQEAIEYPKSLKVLPLL